MPIEQAVERVRASVDNHTKATAEVGLQPTELVQAMATLLANRTKLEAEVGRLRGALEDLRPGLILDLRYADMEDDDVDALRSRVRTVEAALAGEVEGGK
jgi:uncharacterized phage infection (PIP) family protein YhgE